MVKIASINFEDFSFISGRIQDDSFKFDWYHEHKKMVDILCHVFITEVFFLQTCCKVFYFRMAQKKSKKSHNQRIKILIYFHYFDNLNIYQVHSDLTISNEDYLDVIPSSCTKIENEN